MSNVETVKSKPQLEPLIHDQIQSIEFVKARPVIVCDADEVIFEFVQGLETFLHSKNLWLDLTSYRLTGNIKNKHNEALSAQDVKVILEDFFEDCATNLTPVEGVIPGLEQLNSVAQIVILTNIPHAHKSKRVQALAQHGLNYPVISNSGSKGPAIYHIAQKVEAPCFFIDDSIHHLDSAKEHWQDLQCLHFVADERLRGFASELKLEHKKLESWPEIVHHIQSQLDIS